MSTQQLPTAAATLEFLAPYHPPATAADLLANKLNRPLPLHATARETRRAARAATAPPARTRPQPLTAREKRTTKAHQLPRKGLNYGDFEALNKLWLGYVGELVGMGGGAMAMAQRLANADLHGAPVEVVRCRCVDRVGIEGIVVKESRGTVEVVGKDGRVRVLAKEGTVFRLEVPREGRKMVFEIHGSQMVYRAGERAGKKFKMKPLGEV